MVLTVQLMFERDSNPAAPGVLQIGEGVVPVQSLEQTHQRGTAHLHDRGKRAAVLSC